MSEVTVKEKIDTRVRESDLPPRVYTPIPEGYRPTLTRTYATPSYVRHVAKPPEPPQVPARDATPEEIPSATAKTVAKLEKNGWTTKVVYSVHADGKAETTIMGRRTGQVTMVSWTVKPDEDTEEIVGSARTNMLWPHKGRPTSMLGASAWEKEAGVAAVPKKAKKR